ncbi:MAG TPA: NfeD family protein [Methanocella sp.]|nr:NfeD family protein [Methanocella sp.]
MVMDSWIGWLMLAVGALLLVAEVLIPGFFVAVPGTILVIMGVLVIVAPDLLTFPWGLIILAVATIGVSAATIIVYSRLAPGHKPISINIDTLAGKKGEVIKEVLPGNIDGKVKIDEQIWSATSSDRIGVGQKIVVSYAQGVHVFVCRDTGVMEGGECKR